jgi:arsenate-mycothiol transferase
MRSKPSVLFVCVKNAGKSQMAAGLMRKVTGDSADVYSAGTAPGAVVNEPSAQPLAEVGVGITDQLPKLVDPEVIRSVDLVVTLGREARVESMPGTRFENWDTDEPSERGVDGLERMRLVRDDIAAPVSTIWRNDLSASTNRPISNRPELFRVSARRCSSRSRLALLTTKRRNPLPVPGVAALARPISAARATTLQHQEPGTCPCTQQSGPPQSTGSMCQRWPKIDPFSTGEF